MINLTLEQTDGTLTQNYTLHLAAAPIREIWFSTTNKFTAGSGEFAFTPDMHHFAIFGLCRECQAGEPE